jgi:hypothetical protein
LVGYAKAISILFTLQGFPSPVNPSDPNNAGGIIIMNHKREGHCSATIPPQLRNPGKTWYNGLVISLDGLRVDMTCLGHFIGPPVSEYAQTSAKKVDYHTYPSGNKVIQAFSADDFVFFNEAGNTLELCDNSCLDQVHKVKITWRTQKNRRNGQAITISAKKHVTKYALFVPLEEWCFGHNV